MPFCIIGTPQQHCPPVAHGGFWYLKREDGAILLDDNGEYVQFPRFSEARAYVKWHVKEPCEIEYMPQVRED